MEDIRAFDKKLRNMYKQFERCFDNVLKCEKNCEQTSLMQLKLFKILKFFNDFEVLMNSIEIKYLKQRIRVGEFSKLGNVPRKEVELLLNYERFLEAKMMETARLIAVHMQTFCELKLERNLYFNLLPNMFIFKKYT